MKKISLFTKLLKWFACSFLYRVKLHNSEVLDKYNSYLICANHSCVFDPVFIFPVMYEDDISIIAKEDLFKYFWFRCLTRKYHIISINREQTDVKSLLKSLNVFNEKPNAKLILFPEGRIVKTNEDVGNVYKKGAAFIAVHMNKPIIPVYITRRPKFFHKVDVVFGEPYYIEKSTLKGSGKFELESKKLIDKIYELNIEK